MSELSNTYQALALRTKSDQVHADLAPAWMVVAILTEIVEHVKKLDVLKKALFYGKPIPPGIFSELAFQFIMDDGDIDKLQARMENVDIDVLHGIVGVVTEAGELAELLLGELEGDGKIDPDDAAEETGDLMWYQALLLSALGYGFSRVQQMNINKLRIRYPDKFTTEAALMRADQV